jgi:putative transposase
MPRPRKPASPFKYFNSSPEVIRLVVLMYVRFPLSLRNVEDLLFERGIDVGIVRLSSAGRTGPGAAFFIRRQRTRYSTPPWRRLGTGASCFAKLSDAGC